MTVDSHRERGAADRSSLCGSVSREPPPVFTEGVHTDLHGVVESGTLAPERLSESEERRFNIIRTPHIALAELLPRKVHNSRESPACSNGSARVTRYGLSRSVRTGARRR